MLRAIARENIDELTRRLQNTDVSLMSMKQFLASTEVEFHPTYTVPMKSFFARFTAYCARNDLKAHRRKYGDLWKDSGIRCVTRKKERYLAGVQVS